MTLVYPLTLMTKTMTTNDYVILSRMSKPYHKGLLMKMVSSGGILAMKNESGKADYGIRFLDRGQYVFLEVITAGITGEISNVVFTRDKKDKELISELKKENTRLKQQLEGKVRLQETETKIHVAEESVKSENKSLFSV